MYDISVLAQVDTVAARLPRIVASVVALFALGCADSFDCGTEVTATGDVIEVFDRRLIWIVDVTTDIAAVYDTAVVVVSDGTPVFSIAPDGTTELVTIDAVSIGSTLLACFGREGRSDPVTLIASQVAVLQS